jgi:hypothetical protein
MLFIAETELAKLLSGADIVHHRHTFTDHDGKTVREIDVVLATPEAWQEFAAKNQRNWSARRVRTTPVNIYVSLDLSVGSRLHHFFCFSGATSLGRRCLISTDLIGIG